ncbi:hypothetical protein [Acetobacterium woodii]|uniref:hypothetical protein n=1 Tax=Acetobacterium woodii TaxID=33952 RepID=UPI0002E714DE|nr:hypothetical protein [Acetobacterium woodii]
MATEKKSFTMRMQPDNFEKIKYISEHNKRSIAMQIEFLIEACISDFESQHGSILISTLPKEDL